MAVLKLLALSTTNNLTNCFEVLFVKLVAQTIVVARFSHMCISRQSCGLCHQNDPAFIVVM